MRRAYVMSAIVLALVAMTFVGKKVRHRDQESVESAIVQAAPLQSSVLASGQLAFRERVELKPQVIGQVLETFVDEGDRVEAGQVVVRLDPERYEAQVQQQEAVLRQQETSIQAQRVTIANLEREWQRKKQYFEKRFLNASDFDADTTRLELARIELRSREDAVLALKAQLDQAREDLKRTIIRSPIDGVVVSMHVKTGETVIAGTNIPGSTMLEIADPTETLAEVEVDEADINQIRVGAAARVDAASLPGSALPGRVRSIASSVSDDPGRSGRRFKVRIALDGAPSAGIRPGMSCRAEIVTLSKASTLSVPIAGILYDEAGADGDTRTKASRADEAGGAYVIKIEDGAAVKVPVKTGISNDQAQEILSGLAAGDEVVVGPYLTLHHLEPGTRLLPMRSSTTAGSP
jgi:HlyD family secretion protein